MAKDDALGRIAAIPERRQFWAEPGPLRVWLEARKKVLKVHLGVPGDRKAVDWDAVAAVVQEALRAEGGTSADPSPPTVTGILLRKTWWRVCRPSGKAPKRKMRELREKPKRARAPAAPSVEPPPDVRILRPAAPQAPVPPTGAASGTADDKIAQLKADLAGRGHQMPRIVD